MTSGLIRTQDPTLLRDPNTGAIQVADMYSFEHYKAMREQFLRSRSREEKTEQLEDKVARLESLVEDLLKERSRD